MIGERERERERVMCTNRFSSWDRKKKPIAWVIVCGCVSTLLLLRRKEIKEEIRSLEKSVMFVYLHFTNRKQSKKNPYIFGTIFSNDSSQSWSIKTLACMANWKEQSDSSGVSREIMFPGAIGCPWQSKITIKLWSPKILKLIFCTIIIVDYTPWAVYWDWIRKVSA